MYYYFLKSLPPTPIPVATGTGLARVKILILHPYPFPCKPVPFIINEYSFDGVVLLESWAALMCDLLYNIYASRVDIHCLDRWVRNVLKPLLRRIWIWIGCCLFLGFLRVLRTKGRYWARWWVIFWTRDRLVTSLYKTTWLLVQFVIIDPNGSVFEHRSWI